jgi:hypothetical protein
MSTIQKPNAHKRVRRDHVRESLASVVDTVVNTVVDTVVDTSGVVPEFIELPRSGEREPRTTLTRSALDLLTRPQKANDFNPPVTSRLFFQTGSKQARRLVHYPSLLAYLFSLPNGADPNPIRRKGKHLPKQSDR